MRNIRISRRHYRDKRWLEPLPLDPRDPDIMRAKRIARPVPPARSRRAGSRGRA